MIYMKFYAKLINYFTHQHSLFFHFNLLEDINLNYFSQTKAMSYYNYHGIAKKLIQTKHCTYAEFVQKYNHISPALVLYFDNHKPMPIRENQFSEYLILSQFYEIVIFNEDIVAKFPNKGWQSPEKICILT